MHMPIRIIMAVFAVMRVALLPCEIKYARMLTYIFHSVNPKITFFFKKQCKNNIGLHYDA